MIEQNKYTDETIHVANWLLHGGEVDLVKEAEGAAANFAQFSPRQGGTFRDYFAEILESRIQIDVWEAMPEAYGDEFTGVNSGWYTPGDYDESGSADLLLPFISQAFRRVDFNDVAALILKHRP